MRSYDLLARRGSAILVKSIVQGRHRIAPQRCQLLQLFSRPTSSGFAVIIGSSDPRFRTRSSVEIRTRDGSRRSQKGDQSAASTYYISPTFPLLFPLYNRSTFVLPSATITYQDDQTIPPFTVYSFLHSEISPYSHLSNSRVRPPSSQARACNLAHRA